MLNTKRKKIYITLGSIGGVSAVATPSGIAIAEMAKNNKGVNMPSISNKDLEELRKQVDEIHKKIETLEKGKVSNAVMIALINQLENYLDKPMDRDTIIIVKAILGSLKQALTIA